MTGILTSLVLTALSCIFPPCPHRVETGREDIPLYYSVHRGGPRSGRVLLLSGAGSSWKIWGGLTRYLTGKGFDVWAAEFPEEGGTGFDEFVDRGIPALLARIPGRADWVGYDAGGLALLAHLSSHASHPGRQSVGRGVCIGCPVRPEVPYKAVKEALEALGSDPRAPALSEDLIALLLANDGLEESELLWFLSEGKSRALIKEAVQWYEKGCWCSSDGSRNYAEGLASVTSPVLFIAGQGDTVVPPWLSFPGFTGISSKEKLFRAFGRVNGYSREYGHLGLVLGTGARTEVFPAIYQWLRKGSVKYAWQEELPF